MCCGFGVKARAGAKKLVPRGVEKQLTKVPGIKQVDANCASGSATVRYDETLVDLSVASRRKLKSVAITAVASLCPRTFVNREIRATILP